MVELILWISGICIVIGVYVLILYLISMGIVYGYWGLSIGMAPVLWSLMIVGALIGFLHVIRNGIKAVKAVRDERRV